MPQVTFRGTVFSGNGEGKKFIDLPWVKRQIQEKLGYTPYSGTLNLHLTKESQQKKKLLEKAEKFEIKPEEGYCTGILVRAFLDGLDCAVIVPKVRGYPGDVLEVIAACSLRERCRLQDGSAVSVKVSV